VDDTRVRVVLVDDSSDVRRLLRRALEAAGSFEVVAECGDGDEAIALAYRHRPDLLLLDTSMPRMDGLEALPAIVALCPDTAVVMFSGFEDVRLAARARELGAAAFVEKSTPLDQIPARLAGLFQDRVPACAGPTARLRLLDDEAAADEAALHEGQAVLDEHVASFRELFDQAAIGMATLTIAGRIVRANQALATLFRATPMELVGVDYGQLASGHGDDLDRELEALAAGGQQASFEHDLPEGARGPGRVMVTLAPIRDSERRLLYVFAQVQDVTDQRAAEEDLRRSEERFRLLVRGVREYAIFLLDVHGQVISWNAGAARIKGYTADDIIGRHFRVFYLPEEQEDGHPERNLQTALADGQLAEEGWRVRKDGTRFWASVVISPVYDDRGQHRGFAKVTRDRTDQRDAERERQELIARQTEVLALTAHELRNPTAVIDGSARLLRSSWPTLSADERDETIDGIGSSAQRLHRLARDLTTASRLHAERLEMQLVETALTEILAGAVARARNLYPGADIELREPTDVVMLVDAVRLGQSLDNLLDNAVRHGSPPVSLSVSSDGLSVRITVSDRGAGIPPELAPRLFEMFASAGPNRASGLGLYLVRLIARRHGGEVEYVPASDERGARFVMTLPHVR
jgi:PAS domain S-box-containing protein